MPRMKTEIDSRDTPEAVSTIELPMEGSVTRETLMDTSVTDVRRDKNYLDALAFMEEPVKVMVHESTDENAQLIVDLYCNGIPQRLVRGMEHVVKRKFIQVLCAKTTNVRTITGIENGQVVNMLSQHTGLRYPFSIIEDRNPRGAAWLREALASA